MGIYFNPGNEGFKIIRHSNYVDKTGMIDYVNGTIGTASRMTCFSRPRRFGKSFAAKMLCAYYDKSCGSHTLFDDLEIAKKASYEEHLNQYDMIYLDITYFISISQDIKQCVKDMQKCVIRELREQYNDIIAADETILSNALVAIAGNTGCKFIIIIDEWDALFREAKDAIIEMLGGGSVRMKIGTFQNDITSFGSRDDVLTLLVHYGYLGYNAENKKAYIPNIEVALKGYQGNLLLVGINYDKETKSHSCVIEEA